MTRDVNTYFFFFFCLTPLLYYPSFALTDSMTSKNMATHYFSATLVSLTNLPYFTDVCLCLACLFVCLSSLFTHWNPFKDIQQTLQLKRPVLPSQTEQ